MENLLNINELEDTVAVVKSMELYKDYNEFCETQADCKNCEFVIHKMVEDYYEQPCEQVWKLCKIIQEQFK